MSQTETSPKGHFFGNKKRKNSKKRRKKAKINHKAVEKEINCVK